MSTVSYNVGLIGCGRVGALLEEDPLRKKPASHMGGIQSLYSKGKIASLSICDINQDRLEHCREQWSLEAGKCYLDYKELLAAEKPDIVIIATWTLTHKDIAFFAAKHGVKGIVLEKPVAQDLILARQIIDACRSNKVKLVINHERRWDPLYRKTREIIKSGDLGKVKCIYGNVLSQSALRGDWQAIIKSVGGGPLLHDGTHLADILRYFTGEIHTINGNVFRESPEFGTETTATAMMTTHDGINIFLEAGGMRDYFNFELDIHLEKGRIKVGNGIREFYTSETSRRYSGFKDLVKTPFPPLLPPLEKSCDPFSGALLEVMHALEEDTEPDSSGLDGFKAMEIIFGIYSSALKGGKTVTLPLKALRNPLKSMFQRGLL